MQGYNTCWVPGTDHASIATEAKVVAMLREKGIDKKSISRDEFLKYAWEWKEKYGGIILQQLRKLGCSLDWDRTISPWMIIIIRSGNPRVCGAV
jgi:valyl-tRNA synthetase